MNAQLGISEMVIITSLYSYLIIFCLKENSLKPAYSSFTIEVVFLLTKLNILIKWVCKNYF